MKRTLLLLFASLLCGCARGDRPSFTYVPAAFGDNPFYITLPRTPFGCVVRVYRITPKMLPNASRKIMDWKDDLEFYGIAFPRGGYAAYYYTEHVLVVANTKPELDRLNLILYPDAHPTYHPSRLTLRSSEPSLRSGR